MPDSDLQVGFVSMEPKTGYVTALVGGRDYSTSQYNRVTVTERQPGSAIKPFLYAAALEKGYSPLTFKDVSKTTFTYDNGRKEYNPKNVNGKFADHEISLAQALAISDNVYAVKTLVDIGYKDFREMLDRFGLNSSKKELPSLALGSGGTESSLYNLTAAYSTIAAGGIHHEPTTILSIEDAEGNIVYENKDQKGTKEQGHFETYSLKEISPNSSFLEMMDVLNEQLINDGQEPVAFDHDCREGICGMCSMYINGEAHGPDDHVTTCQLHILN